MKKKLNPTLIYVLSILGFICCCLGGAVLSIPAYVMAHNKVKDAELHPDDYEGDLKAMKTAKTVALISAIISGLILIRIIYVVATSDWDELTRTIEDAIEQARQQQG
ncbi:CCC motif membrane protein [Yeosuana marina]|uniref:CCC motif membrane protein n=1 Tax=Yeosuana marina TaxID=1565536 RepID=UPI001422A7EE|nr:CCC motif membrane protein [Yeosuana marina]|tara:strand:+ start:673 stop:993 length:321 start_codon:yes stop_codon:yes gene_type:complete